MKHAPVKLNGSGMNGTDHELMRIINELEAHMSWLLENGLTRVSPAEDYHVSVVEDRSATENIPEQIDGEKADPDYHRTAEDEVRKDNFEGRTAKISEQNNLSEASINFQDLDSLCRYIGDCRRCKLHEKRRNLVFGTGNPRAKLVFIGEGPGEREDAVGEPFVGPAGQLLDKMIGAMGFERKDVYIMNVVKCRPPGNRDPKPEEVAECRTFLEAQLNILSPEVIVCLGRCALQCMTDNYSASIMAMRGKWLRYLDVDMMPTFHPAFLLRDPGKKKLAWQDLQMVMKRLGIRV